MSGPVEHLTERARQVLVLADDEARASGRQYIGTEHLLLGLLREEEGLAARVLDEFGVTIGETRAKVDRHMLNARQQPPLTSTQIYAWIRRLDERLGRLEKGEKP